MADPRFRGCGVAIVTPFDEEGVNEDVLRDLVRFHVAEGTAALIVCGSTGEAAAMSAAEQERAIATTVEAAAGDRPVIAGCGGSDTAAVARLAGAARGAGADAVLLSAPPYNKPTQPGLIAHFRRVMDAAQLPAILYNVPGRTAVDIRPATLAELADGDERVIGVKEACGDISQVAELASLLPDDVALYSGNDDQIVPIMALGGLGVISVLGNVVPALVAEMTRRFLDGDVAGACELQLRLLPLTRALFAESNPIPVKAAVAWLGFDVGPVRLPLVEVTSGLRSRLIEAMGDVGVEPRAAEPRGAGRA